MGERRKASDQRPELRISRDTWDREDEPGQHRIVGAAAQQGFRLVVVDRDGGNWTRPVDVARW